MSDLEVSDSGSLKGALEALLLVSSDAVSAIELAKVTGARPGEVEEALADLSAEYADKNRGIQLREVAGGWRLFTHPAYHDLVESYVLSWDTRKLSQAALETLSVIAYQQPVTREGVKAVRGVNSEGVINSLIEKGLIKSLGRDLSRATQSPMGRRKRSWSSLGSAASKTCPTWKTLPRMRSQRDTSVSGSLMCPYPPRLKKLTRIWKRKMSS